MRERDGLRSRLIAERQQAATEAAEKISRDENVEEDVKKIDAYTKLLALMPAPRLHSIWMPTILAGFCLLIASVAWTLRVPTATLHVEVKTSDVSLLLLDNLKWEGAWQASMVRLDDFSNIEVPPEVRTSGPLAQRAWLDVEARVIHVTRLEASQKARLTFTRDGSGTLHILVRNGLVRGSVDVAGRARISGGRGAGGTFDVDLPSLIFDPPGTFKFADDGRTGEPTHLRVKANDKLTLKSLVVGSIGFMSETTDEEQETSFVSGITDGKITLSSTGEVVMLGSGDVLRLRGSKGSVSRLDIGPDGFQLIFDGEAKQAWLGASSPNRNLKPTVLEYLYHQQKQSFFWGAVTFSWGLLWSIRKMFSA
jgi:hypothetical protein